MGTHNKKVGTSEPTAEEVSEVLMHKYFCNGAESANNAHETWSSSKIFAVANAAGALREREGQTVPSGVFGLPSTATGKNGVREQPRWQQLRALPTAARVCRANALIDTPSLTPLNLA